MSGSIERKWRRAACFRDGRQFVPKHPRSNYTKRDPDPRAKRFTRLKRYVKAKLKKARLL